MSTLLEANHIVKQYASHKALDDVTVHFPEGCVFGLLGPNGAGKTTLIRIMTQITAPDSGTLIFQGKPLERDHIYQIGYLPEERGLYKKMKVGEQAMYLARLKGLSQADAKTKLHYWFKKFEITQWWDKKIEELSKGMAQKVQFITTILHEPKFLILDEPFSGFDPINAELIKGEILELKKKGTTIVLSTHNMSSVEEICDNIALINKSKKLLDGKVTDVRKTYSTNTFEIDYRGTTEQLERALGGSFDLQANGPKGDYLSARISIGKDAQLNTLLQQLIPHVDLNGATEIIPTMNDIFIKVVGANNAGVGSGLTE
ncbi:MAG: ATP-binding cassette domain-containing protein [Bacteroidota bacterium]